MNDTAVVSTPSYTFTEEKRCTPDDTRPVLITGGAGFIGTNLAARLMARGHRVVVLDNLSRPGAEKNIVWLKGRYPGLVSDLIGDIRDREIVRAILPTVKVVYHFAAQVAVTTSIERPLEDFSVNVFGTVQLLDCLRNVTLPPPIIFTSTNKVYGALHTLGLQGSNSRYEPLDAIIRERGISEAWPLSFCSPYGCSKGAADQYITDYSRTYGIQSVVFRMSCIYGPHQFGTEDQGWVAHFMRSMKENKPLVVYGDGKQVRDLLFVEDLVDALLAAWANIPAIQGEAFNIGGGVRHTISLNELIATMARLFDKRLSVSHAPWRVGDQRYYVSDTAKFNRATGWRPVVSVAEGLKRLSGWFDGRVPEERFTVRKEMTV